MMWSSFLCSWWWLIVVASTTKTVICFLPSARFTPSITSSEVSSCNKWSINKSFGTCKPSLSFLQKSNTRIRQRSSRLFLKTFDEQKENASTIALEEHERNHAYNVLQPLFDFDLDEWQVEAGAHIIAGRNVIACAPTGAGKTVIGEMALHIATNSHSSKKAIYTTPLKALSNQKFMDFLTAYGKHHTVGLSTGDMSIHRGAQITVMTTEVYRNMAWRNRSGRTRGGGGSEGVGDGEDGSLEDVGVVILDEFHYMGQPGRGGVWEESVITTPPHTQILSLSATLPNAHHLAAWMTRVTGRPTALVQAQGPRPVPLRYMFATSDGLSPLFANVDAGPGAPLGLLGLRGDGMPQEGSEGQQHSGQLPRGLRLHPSIEQAAIQRRNRVERQLQRMTARREENEIREELGLDWERPRGRSSTVMSPREMQRQRNRLFRNEQRRAVPSLPYLVRQLNKQDLLPAIVFVFSRAGCDAAAVAVCEDMLAYRMTKRKTEKAGRQRAYKKMKKQREIAEGQGKYQKEALVQDTHGRVFRITAPASTEDPLELAQAHSLLNPDQVLQVATRVETFNKENPELALDSATSLRLYLGVGAHHAGMLPAHKELIETLFAAQLLKVVFATETLAAGMNMPARTTVISNLAKRTGSGSSGSSIQLLETANLLQMAGRAGRRGMDAQGTCILMATPFEGAAEAAKIVVSEIQPIVSQFRPSYNVAVHLVARAGLGGSLKEAKNMIAKSFAVFERERLKNEFESRLQLSSMDTDEAELSVGQRHERFWSCMEEVLSRRLQQCVEELREENGNPRTENLPSLNYAVALENCVVLLSSPRALQKEAKALAGQVRMLDAERETLSYLRRDAREIMSSTANPEEISYMQAQVDLQLERVEECEALLENHSFTELAQVVNHVLLTVDGEGIDEEMAEVEVLRRALALARNGYTPSKNKGKKDRIPQPLIAEELGLYSKNAAKVRRKLKKKRDKEQQRKLEIAAQEEVGDLKDALDMLDQIMNEQSEHAEEDDDGAWQETNALFRVLEAYGCLSPTLIPTQQSYNDNINGSESSGEDEGYIVTPTGENVAMLHFDNSLWALVAMGGAWDVHHASSRLDQVSGSQGSSFFPEIDDGFWYGKDEDDTTLSLFPNPKTKEKENDDSGDKPPIPTPQTEAEELASELRSLTPAEMAGYVACLVSENRNRNDMLLSESLCNLSAPQQRVARLAMMAAERLMEVQQQQGLLPLQYGAQDQNQESNDHPCHFDISMCDVVTAWAAGCTWNEAVEMSQLAPGDLVRVLHRAMDALRQFGALPYTPVRREGTRTAPNGLDADIRGLCRDAATAMNRYPLKDPLPFAVDDGQEDEEEDEEGGEEEDEEEHEEEREEEDEEEHEDEHEDVDGKEDAENRLFEAASEDDLLQKDIGKLLQKDTADEENENEGREDDERGV